jgi:hypothetical protein
MGAGMPRVRHGARRAAPCTRTGRQQSRRPDHRTATRLYIGRSVNNEIATVRLSFDKTQATVVSERTFPGADTLTGVALSGSRLLVTNSQMGTYLYGTPLTSQVFTIESLPLY